MIIELPSRQEKGLEVNYFFKKMLRTNLLLLLEDKDVSGKKVHIYPI